MANKIKLKRGLSTNIDSLELEAGELAITTDTSELYAGDKNNNAVKINDNTTYALSKNGSSIILTGSDGSTTSVADSNTTYSAATTSANGLMSSSDKTKLNGIATGATANSASTTTPKAAGTAATGSESAYARGDHVHPAQTTVSGNAGTATKFASKQSVALTGDVTGSASSQAGWSVTTTLADSGVTAGSYGPTANVTGTDGTTINVPQITVDAKGRVTSVVNRVYTSKNTDTNTTYSVATTSANGLMSSTDKSKLDGIASGANAYVHPSYTARTGKPTANQTPAFGGTATVSQITSDATGHVTAATDRTITIPSTLSNGTGTAGLIKTSSTVTSNSGYTACPVISGVPYYKDTNTTYSAATTSANGLMSSSDKTKLNGIATGAQVNNVVVSTSQPTASTAEVWVNPNGQTTISSLDTRVTTLEDDTGWQNLSLISGVSAARARIRRKNGVVYIEIINLTGWTNQTAFTTIPVGYRPQLDISNSYRWAAPTTGAAFTRPELYNDGTLCIFTTTSTAGAWTDVIVSYIADGY